jgi:Fe-S-cluster containining protein
MIRKTPVVVPGEHRRTEDGFAGEFKTLGFELDCPGGRLRFDVRVARRHASLSDMVPLARMLSAKLSLATLNDFHREGRYVPCRKGCPACCYYMVPLSVPEALRLREDISLLPGDQHRDVYRSCLAAAKIILGAIPKDFDSGQLTQTTGQSHLKQLGAWYAGLSLACPFLSNDLCTSYRTRPIACREHLVTGSAAACNGEGAAEPSVAPAPVSVLECLGRLAAELEQSELEAVLLPLALPWAQENIERSRRMWPATTMVERFIEILQAAAARTRTREESETTNEHSLP